MRPTSIAVALLPLALQVVARQDPSSGMRAMRRQMAGTKSGNGLPYPEPGDDSPTQMPQEWTDALNKAVAAGKIPNIPQTTLDNNTGLVAYPQGYDYAKNACSWSLTNCMNGDIYLAPPGKVGITFDDGPTPQTPSLLSFLQDKHQTASHFLIGSAIMWNPDDIKALASASNPPAHLGCHTFSHSLQSSKTNEQIVSDLGWNMQLILDLTGKVPMYWRAPQGDVDNRVRAVAKEVLGLQHVMWGTNNDADDWCLRQGSGTAQLETCTSGVGKSYQSVVDAETGWAKGDKSKGFISLEHETTDQAINAFKEYYAALTSNGWNVSAIPDLQGLPWYQNQYSPTTPVVKTTSILPTRKAIDVTDSSAAPGTSGAPDVSAYNDLKQGIAAASTSTSTSNSTASSTVPKTTTGSAGHASNSSTTATNGTAAHSGTANGAVGGLLRFQIALILPAVAALLFA